MERRLDTEELLVELQERGIDVDITLQQTDYVVQFTNAKDNIILGIAKSNTLEGAITTIIRQLADDSKFLKEKVNVTRFDGLSQL